MDVKRKERWATRVPEGAWTRPDDYLAAMARKASFRRAHREKPRTQPQTPRLLLSTLPYLALIVALAVLTVAIMVAAFPGNQPKPRPGSIAVRERGVAPRGWFQEAQREMHR